MAANGLAIYGHKVMLQSLTQKILVEVQVKLFERTINYDLAHIQKFHTGQLVSKCLVDGESISQVVTLVTLSIARDLVMFLALAGVMVYRDWISALVVMMAFPLVGVAISRLGRP